MQTIIGPVLVRSGLYAFDSWTQAAGFRRGFGYRRIDDAYYARNAKLTIGAIACNTLDAFLAEMQSVSAQPALAA